jgi:hypothetical protein
MTFYALHDGHALSDGEVVTLRPRRKEWV